jgi:hypothetical protein
MTGFAGEGPVRREHAMINDGNDGDGEMSKATESLDLAKDAVNSARAKVDEVGRHLRGRKSSAAGDVCRYPEESDAGGSNRHADRRFRCRCAVHLRTPSLTNSAGAGMRNYIRRLEFCGYQGRLRAEGNTSVPDDRPPQFAGAYAPRASSKDCLSSEADRNRLPL